MLNLHNIIILQYVLYIESQIFFDGHETNPHTYICIHI